MSVAAPTPTPKSGPLVEPPRYVTRFTQRLALGALKGATAAVRRLVRTRRRFVLGNAWVRWGYRIDKRRCRFAARNLRMAFGDFLSPREQQALIRGTFTHWGVATVDFLRNAGHGRRRR